MDQQWNKKKLQAVLIESDWNLKKKVTNTTFGKGKGINRIRLEFKERLVQKPLAYFSVLIESDWNLKLHN